MPMARAPQPLFGRVLVTGLYLLQVALLPGTAVAVGCLGVIGCTG